MMKAKRRSLIALLTLATALLFVFSVVVFSRNGKSADAETAYSSLSMNIGAKVRLSDDYESLGLRFEMQMSAQDYSDVMNHGDVTFGIIIAPSAYHQDNPINRETLFGEKPVYDWAIWNGSAWEYPETSTKTRVINITANSLIAKQDVMVMNGSITGIKSYNLLKKFIGIGYISYNDGVETQYLFATANDNVRCMVEVAQMSLLDSKSTLTSEEKQMLSDSYLTAEVLGQSVDYSVDYYIDGEFKENVVYSDKTINSEVSATIKEYANCKFDEDNSNNLTNGILLANGKVYAEGAAHNALKVYYQSLKTVTFDTGKGSSVANQTVVCGEKATLPEIPVLYGYTFNGWLNNGVAFDFETEYITEDLTLTADWSKTVYAGAIMSDAVETYTYTNGETIVGKKITATAGQGYHIADNVAFSGDIMGFGFVSKSGDSKVYDFDVIFTDLTTDVRFIANFMLNSDAVRVGAVYGSWKMNGVKSKSEILTVDMADTNLQTYGSILKRTQQIKFTGSEMNFAGSFFNGSWSNTYFETPDLSGFGADGVSVDICFNGVNDSGSVILSYVGDTDFAQDYEKVEENQKFTYSTNEEFIGKKVTVASSGKVVRIAENVKIAEGKSLFNVGLCNLNGANTVNSFSIILSNVNDANDKLVVTASVRSGTGNGTGWTTVSYNYNGSTITGEFSMDIRDSGYSYNSSMPRNLNVLYKSTSPADGSGTVYDFAVNGFARDWTYGFNGLDLSTLVASGVNVDLRFDSVSAMSSIIIASVGDVSFSCFIEEDQTHLYNILTREQSQSTITGTKYTTSASGTRITVAESAKFDDKIIEFGYVNNGGAFTINTFVVAFTDKTGNVLNVRFQLSSSVRDADSVYISYSYNGSTYAANIQHTCDMSDASKGAWSGQEQEETMFIRLTAEKRLEFEGSIAYVWTNGFDLSGVLSDFNSDDVKVEIIFEDISATSSVIVKSIAKN